MAKADSAVENFPLINHIARGPWSPPKEGQIPFNLALFSLWQLISIGQGLAQPGISFLGKDIPSEFVPSAVLSVSLIALVAGFAKERQTLKEQGITGNPLTNYLRDKWSLPNIAMGGAFVAGLLPSMTDSWGVGASHFGGDKMLWFDYGFKIVTSTAVSMTFNHMVQTGRMEGVIDLSKKIEHYTKPVRQKITDVFSLRTS